MINWLKKLFKRKHKVIDFPKNTSWLLNPDFSINKENIKSSYVFQQLEKAPHSKKWHKEGNPLKHSFLVANEMFKIINTQLSGLPTRDKKILMIAAICHDLGKAKTTYYDEKEKDWKCKNHGVVGERITRTLLFNEPDYWMREEICWLVRWHMQFHHFVDQPHEKQFQTLTTLSQGASTIQKLLWLNMADTYGSKSKLNTKESAEEKFQVIKDMAESNSCYTRPYHAIRERKEKYNMYIMIGVPGSGKDTYIQKFLKNTTSICRDDIREELMYGKITGRKLLLDKEHEALVTEIVNNQIKQCCEEHKSFIINQTNLKKKYRTQLKEMAFKYGNPNIVYIYVEAPSIDVCKERRGHGKWDSIIDRMWNEMEFPDKSECDELVFYKQKSV